MQKNISLDGEITIYQARETYTKLADALPNASELNIELSNVTDVDSSCLQILLWLQKEGARLNIKVVLLHPSEVLQRVIAQLGLTKSFSFGGTYEQ